jgi:hypothetical protein
MSHAQKIHCRAKGSAAALMGWGALVWVAFWVAPYLYALNDFVQWR